VTATAAAAAPSVRDAEARLAVLEEARATALATIEHAERQVAFAETTIADCDEAEADVALGETDPEIVAHDRANATHALERAAAEIVRQRAALQGIEQRITAAERVLVEARLARVADRLEALCGERDAATDRLRDRARAAIKEARVVVKARQSIADLIAEERAAAPAGVELPSPSDEQEWRVDGWAELVALLVEGPHRPHAKSAAILESQPRISPEEEAVAVAVKRILDGGYWKPEFGWPLNPEAVIAAGADLGRVHDHLFGEPAIHEPGTVAAPIANSGALGRVPEELHDQVFAEVTAEFERRRRAGNEHVARVNADAAARGATLDSMIAGGGPAS
jgi:hypothetical protein